MATLDDATRHGNAERASAVRLGFWSAILTAAVTAVSFAIAIMTPPISGAFCQAGCVTYPYRDVAAYVPHDYVWMYFALLLVPVFVVLMVCICHYATEDRKLYGHIALVFAVIYAVAISIDYTIQLHTMQPSILKGETEGMALFLQYNPHGIFIALEDLGYVAMSLALCFAAPVFSGASWLERAIRWLFVGGLIATLAALFGLGLAYGQDLEYRFEVTVISIDWLLLVVGGVLLSVLFRRAAHRDVGVMASG